MMRRHDYLWGMAWIAFSVVLGLLYVSPPQYIDHRWFDYIGGAMLEGDRPYLEVGDQNFPGIFFLHALALLLFGYHSWSFPLLDYLLMLGFVLVMARALRVRAGLQEALVFVVLYPLMYVTLDSSMAGQRDLLATHLVLLAGVLLLRRIEGGRWAWLILVGLAVFMASIMKPTYAIFAPALPLIDLVSRRQSGRSMVRMAADHTVEALTMVSAACALALIGWLTGVLGAWYEWFTFNYEIYALLGGSPDFLLGRARVMVTTYWPVYVGVAIVGGVLGLWRMDRPLLVLMMAAFATVLVSLIVQRKGWDYHFAAFLPILALLMTESLAWAARVLTTERLTQARQGWSKALPIALATLLVLTTALAIGKKAVGCYRIPIGWQLGYISDEVYLKTYNLKGIDEVVAYVREHTAPQDTVWSFADPLIDLNHLTRRKPPSRFWNPYHIFHAVAPFHLAAAWQAEVIETIRQHPPKIIVMHVIDQGTHEFEYPPRWSKSPVGAVFDEALANGYRRVKTVEDYEIYERLP